MLKFVETYKKRANRLAEEYFIEFKENHSDFEYSNIETIWVTFDYEDEVVQTIFMYQDKNGKKKSSGLKVPFDKFCEIS